MNARFLTQRLALLLTVAMLSQVVTSESLAQSEQAAPPQQSITVGKLIRSGRTQNGKPKFALLDAEGNITGYVVPAAGLNISPYVNQEVGVTARASKQGSDGLPYILAQNATPLSGTGNDTTLSSGKSRGTADDVFSDEELEFALDEKPASSPAARSYPARPTANEPQLLSNDRSFQQLGANRMRDGQIRRTNMQMPYEGEVIVDDSGMGMPFQGSSCGDPGCTSCGGGYGYGCTMNTAGPCGPSGHFWARAEYLLWWTKGMNVPPLVTTSPGTALPQNAGVLGQDTSVLYGDGDILDNARNGG
ncbi:MAG: BBP7 family outer membrane beta-barrel protein, partial [Planctomycetales bacterium]|nr:BBP7 family outer membrane beta-barrel protein [Planctomycetales bacterium]